MTFIKWEWKWKNPYFLSLPNIFSIFFKRSFFFFCNPIHGLIYNAHSQLKTFFSIAWICNGNLYFTSTYCYFKIRDGMASLNNSCGVFIYQIFHSDFPSRTLKNVFFFFFLTFTISKDWLELHFRFPKIKVK